MSSFVPLNLAEDTTVSKKDLEEEHTRELQVEQAFKIFQVALNYQKRKEFLQAYKSYEELFKLDVISNHYYEEEDYIRGIQNGGTNTIVDELNYLSPNVKLLRYLILRNRGFFYFDILRSGHGIMSLIDNVDNTDKDITPEEQRKEKLRELFYTMIEDLCASLIYQEADEKLLETLYEIFVYLDVKRLSKFTLEYSLSGKSESDDLLGFLPVSRLLNEKYKLLLANLHLIDASGSQEQEIANEFERIKKKLDFLQPIKMDFEAQIENNKKIRSININLQSKDAGLDWATIIDVINYEIKQLQDKNKIQDIVKAKLKYAEPYLFSESPIERVQFVMPSVPITISDEVESIAEAEDGTGEVQVKENDEALLMENDEPKESDNFTSDKPAMNEPNMEVDGSHANDFKPTTVIQRSSKRFKSRNDSIGNEIQDYEVTRQDFYETDKFFDNLNSYLKLLKNSSEQYRFEDIIKLYVPNNEDNASRTSVYFKDMIDIINDWNTNFTNSLFIIDHPNENGPSRSADDEKIKLLDVLNKFGSKSNFLTLSSRDDIPKIEQFETSGNISNFLETLNTRSYHYQEIKIIILRRLLEAQKYKEIGPEYICLVSDTIWDPKLFLKVKDWIIQFESSILNSLKINSSDKDIILDNFSFAVSIYEILVDIYITIRSQINGMTSSSSKKGQFKTNKSAINNLSLELIKIGDKLNRWTHYLDDLLFHIQSTSEFNNSYFFDLQCRYRWSFIYKEKSQNVNWSENKFIMVELQNLLDDVKKNKQNLFISLPNYDNINEISSESIRSQLTTTSVLLMFSKILYADSNENNNEAIQLLESFLIDSSCTYGSPGDVTLTEGISIDQAALNSIRKFLDKSPADIKLSLWNILFSYYNDNNQFSRLQYGFEKNLEFILSYLQSKTFMALQNGNRFNTFLKVLGSFGESLRIFLRHLSQHSWKLPNCDIKQSLNPTIFRLLRMFELFFLFNIHEEASLMSSLKLSVKARSVKSYQQLKDIFVRIVSIFFIYYKDYLFAQIEVENAEKMMDHTRVVGDLLCILHEHLGYRNICDSARGLFLKLAQEILTSLNCSSEQDLAQIVFCRYHYSLSIGKFSPVNHGTTVAHKLDIAATYELAKFVLPLCFRKNPLIHTPKQDMKLLIDDFYEVIGDPDFESCEILARNDSSLEHFLESTSITSRFLRDAFYGLLKVDLEIPRSNSAIIKDGLYYLQGLLIFVSYKIRKKNMQSRAVELENIIKLLKNDLVYCTGRVESWLLLGQAYGFLVEDDLIWTSDKLTITDRKVGTANLQRKSLICYLMAINYTSYQNTEHVKELIKPIIGTLMSSFAKEMYSACMQPMGMHCFKVQSNPKFIKKPSGATFISATAKSSVGLNLCLKVMKQSLQLAIKSKPKDWTNYYYLSKVLRKLGKDSSLVLSTLNQATQLAKEQSASSDHIIEPHYMMCSLIYKYVKSDLLGLDDALAFLSQDPVVAYGLDESVNPINNKKDFYKIIVDSLKKINAYDKKKWHHKPRYRLAKVLYDEFDNTSDAIEEMSSFVSLKATSKTLVSIWKPENERPGKHFFYTFQYAQFYIVLLSRQLNLINLILMLPKLRRSNATMISLYTAWENLCSFICRIIRSSLDVNENFTENFMQALPYQTFVMNSKSFLENMKNNGIPEPLEVHFCFLHAVNDMKKFNNGFGPTSLIDDTIVAIFIRIYLYFDKELGISSDVLNTATESPSGRTKKLAKRDVFPFTADILKNFKKNIERILKEKPVIYNSFVKEAEERKKLKGSKDTITSDQAESFSENNNNSSKPVKTPDLQRTSMSEFQKIKEISTESTDNINTAFKAPEVDVEKSETPREKASNGSEFEHLCSNEVDKYSVSEKRTSSSDGSQANKKSKDNNEQAIIHTFCDISDNNINKVKGRDSNGSQSYDSKPEIEN